ncbi:MAG: phage integrase SAM-like domain-containing protein, partial [Bacteroidota bacterium]
ISRMLTIALEICARPKETLKNYTVYELAAIVQENINSELNEVTEKVLPQKEEETQPEVMLKAYGKKVTARFRKAERNGSAEVMDRAIKALIKFSGKEDLPLSEITFTFLLEFEADWLSKGNGFGGLGVVLRAVRYLINLAIMDKSTPLSIESYPFGRHGYSIKKGRSKPRAISIDYIQKIRDQDYKIGSKKWHHRNYFLFMFNLRGMNFYDLCLLKLNSIEGERLIYDRSKTRRGNNVKTFNIKLTDEAKSIFSYYAQGKKKTDLLFPVMADAINIEDKEEVYKIYRSRISGHNYYLSKIAKDIGLEGKLTTYVARHTFATTGLYKGVAKAQIGEMLGHTNSNTTEA